MIVGTQLFVTAQTGINLSQRPAVHTEFAQGSATAFAGVAIAPVEQLLQIVPVVVETLALVDDIAVPFETEGFEVAQDLVGGAVDDARCVDVLDTQKPASVLRFHVAIAGQRRHQRAEMQGSRRCWRESSGRGRQESRFSRMLW